MPNFRSRPTPVRQLSSNRSVGQIQIWLTGVPLSSRWRPHPTGQFLPLTPHMERSSERPVRSETCPPLSARISANIYAPHFVRQLQVPFLRCQRMRTLTPTCRRHLAVRRPRLSSRLNPTRGDARMARHARHQASSSSHCKPTFFHFGNLSSGRSFTSVVGSANVHGSPTGTSLPGDP